MSGRRPNRPRSATGALLLLAALVGGGQAALAQGAASEADLKAAIVFNFAQFTRWPGDPPALKAPFTMCYAGDDVGRAFSQLASRALNNRPVEARRVPAEGPYAGCDLMYWSEGRAPRLIVVPAGSPLLTIGSGSDALQRGAMIQLQIENARLVFSVNVEPARAAGLQISSKLLRLARSVQGSVE